MNKFQLDINLWLRISYKDTDVSSIMYVEIPIFTHQMCNDAIYIHDVL